MLVDAGQVIGCYWDPLHVILHLTRYTAKNQYPEICSRKFIRKTSVQLQQGRKLVGLAIYCVRDNLTLREALKFDVFGKTKRALTLRALALLLSVGRLAHLGNAE